MEESPCASPYRPGHNPQPDPPLPAPDCLPCLSFSSHATAPAARVCFCVCASICLSHTSSIYHKSPPAGEGSFLTLGRLLRKPGSYPAESHSVPYWRKYETGKNSMHDVQSISPYRLPCINPVLKVSELKRTSIRHSISGRWMEALHGNFNLTQYKQVSWLSDRRLTPLLMSLRPQWVSLRLTP